MKKIFLIGLVALMATITAASANAKQYKSPNKVKYEESMKALKGTSPEVIAGIVSSSMAKNVPQKIDLMTTLSRVDAVDNSINSYYTVSIKALAKRYKDKDTLKILKEKKNEIMNKVIAEQHKAMIENICRNPTLRSLLDSGVDYYYKYIIESTGKSTGSFTITLGNCKGFEL